MATPGLYIGNKKVNAGTVSDKIRQDIDFLNAKIIYINGQRNFNTDVLQVYQTMLESRYAVLDWLNTTIKSCPRSLVGGS